MWKQAAGEQPVSNNPTGWNGRGGENTPSFPLAIPVINDLGPSNL